MTYLKVLLVCSVLILQFKTEACSVVNVEYGNTVHLGYTMEWVGDISESQPYEGGGVFLLPANRIKKSVLDGKSFCWKARYKSLVLSVFGPDFPFNGVNEKGLEVYLLGTPSRTIDKRKLVQISELDLLSLLLDTAQNINEVKSILGKVSVTHVLFPMHAFIKDASGNVLIVDFKNGIRFHTPKAGEAILTNGWYDDELAARKANERTYHDDRHLNIKLDIKKNPKDVDGALARAGDPDHTLWRSHSIKTASSWKYVVKILPNTYNPKFRKDMTFDLQKIFSQTINLTQFILFTDFYKSTRNWRTLTDEQNRKIQLANFINVKEDESRLFGRNGNLYGASVSSLNSILMWLEKKPLKADTSSCSL